MTTLEERVTALERHHRRRWLRRAVKLGLLVALALLLLWLLQDMFHAFALLDELQRRVADNTSHISGLQTQVSSLADKMNNVVVKINGQVVPAVTSHMPTLPALHSVTNGALGGLFAVVARLLPFVAM